MAEKGKGNEHIVIQRKVNDLQRKSYAELQSIAENPLVCRETVDGKRYYVEIHARVTERQVQLMVECARDLPLIRWFGRAAYYTVGQDRLLAEGQPW